MSFLSELFHGNLDFGNLAPENIFKDFGSSFQNQPGWAKGLEIGVPLAIGTVLTAGALAPEAIAAEGGLAAAEGAGAGVGEAVGGGEVLSDAAIADFMASPGAQAIASTAGVESPAITGAGAGSSIGAGAGGLTPDIAMSSSIGDVAGISPDIQPAWMGTPIAPDAALTGGTLPGTGGAGAGAVGGGGAGFSPFGYGGVPYTAGGAPITGGMVPPGAAAPGVLDQLGNAAGSIGTGLTKAAPWASAGLLGYNLLQGYQQNQALKAEAADVQNKANAVAGAGGASLGAAQPMLAAGKALMTGGPVPAPMQAMLDQLRNGERARIIQGYGARNQSTDPTQNSALAQDLNNLDTNLMAMREQIGQQIVSTANTLLSTGASATEIAAQLPMMMQRLDIQLQQMSGNAIANFASAMSGGTMKFAGQGSGQNLNINVSGGTGSLAA